MNSVISSNSTPSCVTLDSTVDAVIATIPGARVIMNEHLIDTCCGGGSSLTDAASRAHVDPATLLAALETLTTVSIAAPAGASSVAPPVASSCGCGCR